MESRSRRNSALAVGAVVAAVLAGTVAAASPAQAVTLSPTGKVQVTYRGNGHGHGMSQYGAQGAAIAGRSYKKILAFYYPGTKLVTLPSHRIRVKISTASASVVAVYAASTLTVAGHAGALPTAGVNRYRLRQGSGHGLVLQRLRTGKGAKWATIQTGLSNGAEFHRTNWAPMRLREPGGTSTDYYGFLGAWRNATVGNAGGVTTVDRLSYNNYTAGVAPREMPASWKQAAVRSQAVAARTYGVYAVAHPQSSHYDICDTTACQVYGGQNHYSKSGARLWSGDLAPARATSNQVLRYHGATIFAQFSASNGGWTTNGGQPYLRAKADPYDTAAAGDPYINKKETLSVASLARYFGFRTITGITVTKRDGHGAWGGRVLNATIKGTNAKKKATSKRVTGFDLQYAFGLGTTWFSMKKK